MFEQHYVFTGPDGRPWAESFYCEQHYVAPLPYKTVHASLVALEILHPVATVDTLADEREIAQVHAWIAAIASGERQAVELAF